MRKEDFAKLLKFFITTWIESRINKTPQLEGKVWLNQANLPRAAQAFFLGKLNIKEALHQSDGPDEHKIAWLLVCGLMIYGDDILSFHDSIESMNYKKIINDCALTAFCSSLNINQSAIEQEQELYKTIQRLIYNANDNDFFIGSLVGFLLQSLYPLR